MSPVTRKLLRRLPLLGTVGLLLAGCASKDTKQDIFHPKGQQSTAINDLQVPVFIAAGVVGVLVFAAIGYVIITGKRRSRDADHEPTQIHGNFKAEITWTIIPALILVAVAFPTVKTLLDIDTIHKDSMTIDVYGQQWWWSYEYHMTGDESKPADIITANELVLPVDTDINLRVQSRDVIHSFWIPALNGTRDAVPGRVQPLQMHPYDIGEFDGQCKEFCGLSHANMRAKAVVLSQADFDTWAKANEQDAATPAPGTDAAAGLDIFKTKCASCHQINGVNVVEEAKGLVSGAAPNLTHLMNRTVFASAQYQLWLPNADGKLEFNRNQLEAWLRDPSALLPMAPAEGRGMPNLGLTESEIDKLVSYLQTLGPIPPNAIPPAGS